MKKFLEFIRSSVLLFSLFGTGLGASASQAIPITNPNTVKVEISQAHAATSWPETTEKFLWPAVIVVGMLIFYKPLAALLGVFVNRGADLTIAGVAIRIPALETQVALQTAQISDQQSQLSAQTQQIQRLISFSMSWFIYEMLWQISRAKQFNGEYLYAKDGSMLRNLHFLIEHGYLTDIFKEEPAVGENLCQLVSVTQAGNDLISMRGTPANGRY